MALKAYLSELSNNHILIGLQSAESMLKMDKESFDYWNRTYNKEKNRPAREWKGNGFNGTQHEFLLRTKMSRLAWISHDIRRLKMYQTEAKKRGLI